MSTDVWSSDLGNVVLDTRTLNVSGTTTFGSATGGSNLFLQNGAVVNNLAGTTWNIVNGNGNGIFFNGGTAPAFNKTGAVPMAGGASDTLNPAVKKNRTGDPHIRTLTFFRGGRCAAPATRPLHV